MKGCIGINEITLYSQDMRQKKFHFCNNKVCIGHPPFFFRLLSNALSDFGSVGQKRKKKAKIKLEKESGAKRPGTSA